MMREYRWQCCSPTRGFRNKFSVSSLQTPRVASTHVTSMGTRNAEASLSHPCGAFRNGFCANTELTLMKIFIAQIPTIDGYGTRRLNPQDN
jgi:hypothetical protein